VIAGYDSILTLSQYRRLLGHFGFVAGNLRHIRVGGTEGIRAISFIVRDRLWGTYRPDIADLTVDQRSDGFTVRYRAEVRDDDQRFRYRATIEGRPDRLVFEAEGEAVTVFETNRAGFVVLHPVAGVAGEPVEVEHVDGRIVHERFPDLIDPVQPMSDLRALSHAVMPGLTVTCRMEGDAFEMEDQRNWCDASYKTYVRPLSRPWPYRLPPGEVLKQSVTLTVAGRTRPAAAAAARTCEIAVGEVIGPAPAIGLGFDPAEIDATRRVLRDLADLGPGMVVCHFDPRRGHDRAALDAMVACAVELGAEPWLEAVIAEVEGFENEIAALGALVQSLDSPFRTVLVTPAADLKSTAPGQPWPPAPPPIAWRERPFPARGSAAGWPPPSRNSTASVRHAKRSTSSVSPRWPSSTPATTSRSSRASKRCRRSRGAPGSLPATVRSDLVTGTYAVRNDAIPMSFQAAAAVTERHWSCASARKVRIVLREVRWRWMLNVL